VKIRPKVAALTAGIFAVLGIAAVLVEKQVVLPSFAELERANAGIAMRRIDYALERALDHVAVMAMDWGNWAEAYHFVHDHNAAFVKTSLTTASLRQLNVNVLMIVDKDGRVVVSRTWDRATDAPRAVDLAGLRVLPVGFPWSAQRLGTGPVSGLLPSDRGILMLGAAPILNGSGAGPARGMILMGQLLSPAAVKNLGVQAQADVTLLGPRVIGEQQRLVESDEVMNVYRLFHDIYGRPVMTLRVDAPREFMARGRAAVNYASAYLAGAAVSVLVLLIVVLNRLILTPLAVLTRHAVAVGEDRDLTTRIDLKRSGEIGVLARELDHMVARVAESRTQLVDQSFQAGFAELAKGVLHNLGNAMTPIGVRLANLGQRLRAAPTDDAEQAVTELRAGTSDPQRRADLEEFLRLACQELTGTVRSVEGDVEVMARQAGAIQATLAEQMRSARNEHVIEPVRLTELLAQSLEIVPDSCRQRLVVDTDETLRKLGVVRVARTVLRLILQNLIINAAEAVRDAGKEKGVLRVSAEIVCGSDGQKLHLACKDDGVGIAQQNLERLFEKGFSTKPPNTNQGIGLHWCANAISALGGRIWAASDGPGRGAAMHLVVPIAVRESVPLAGAA
jgi:two-component system NtrC family sensor kinase